MKKILSFAATALLLVGCESEDFTGNNNQVDDLTNQAISFGVTDVKATRGTEVGAKAAELLNNNFILYGFKLNAAEAADATSDQVVMDRYNVNYEAGSADLTQSNTKGWEYVGLTPATGSAATSQNIKYWDYSAKGYVFSAVSGLDITTEKITSATSIYEKGWNVTIPAGGTLQGLYASNRNYVANGFDADHKDYRYPNPVQLDFYNMATKVRFAMYETVSGYSVKIDKFYYNSTNSTTNFGVDGKFKVQDVTVPAVANVTYYSDTEDAAGLGIKNRPKVTWTSGIKDQDNMDFGTNIPAQAKIGTTSAEATYDQAEGVYTYIIPFQDNTNTLTLKVDYTLTSTDGSNESIKVYGATATVPANYTQWKENFAYTYLFKISDKTNGSTTDIPGGPEGLFPITFDACVITEEDGIQETVTSLGEPAITTYAQGTVVTANDEYTAGDIYFSATQGQAGVEVEKATVYEVYNYAGGEITEALVENYQKNKVVLNYVLKTAATAVPLSDGSTISFADKYCYKFEAKAGKTYAIQFEYETGKYAYKVIKVTGTDSEVPAYSLVCDGKKFTGIDDESKITLTNTLGTDTKKGVIGATGLFTVLFNASDEDVTDNFTITEDGEGKYTVKLTEDAIKAGANGTYTVKFNGTTVATKNFTVALNYAFWDESFTTALTNATLTVAAGNKNTFGFSNYIKSSTTHEKISNAVIVNTNEGIEIQPVDGSEGVYQVNAAANVAGGSYTVTIAGKPLKIAVYNYAFKNDLTFVYDYVGNAAAQTLILTVNGKGAAVEASALEDIDPSIATIADGAKTGYYTVTPVAQGSYTVKYENASAKITVNQYTLTPASASIAKSTGAQTLALNLNGKQISASSNNVKVFKGGSQVTTGFSLTTSGQNLVFGNVTEAGTYTFKYTVNGVDVAHADVTVTDPTPAKANLGSMGKGNAGW